MKKYLFLLACFGFLMAGCHKTDASLPISTVNGRLVEFGNTQQGVPNAVVGLLKRLPADCLFCAEKRVTVAVTRSDAEGRFNFTFPDSSAIYYLTVRPNDKRHYPIELFELKEDKQSKLHGNNNLNVEVTPQAFIRFRIKNVNPLDNNDLLRIAGIDDYWLYDFKGMNVDTTATASLAGNMTLELRKIIYRNAIQTVFRDSVKTIAHDTIDVKIFY
jgi:hypothetical protein